MPWFDWCMVNFENWGVYPSRCLLFIDALKMKFKNSYDEVIKKHGRYWAVIKATSDDKRHRRDKGVSVKLSKKKSSSSRWSSRIAKSYFVEDKIRIVSCDAIVDEAFVVADYIEKRGTQTNHVLSCSHVHHIKSPEEWPQIFIDKSKWT